MKTHRELCEIAVRWLKRPLHSNGHGCQIAIPEPRSRNGESPDAIGFRAAHESDLFAGSIVVECKTSRADFLADRKKPWRQSNKGMGKYRYFMCPEGLIQPDELPAAWGLVWVNKRGHCKVITGAVINRSMADLYEHTNRDVDSDQHLLVDWISRIDDAEKLILELRSARSEVSRLFTKWDRAELKNKELRLENRKLREQLEATTS